MWTAKPLRCTLKNALDAQTTFYCSQDMPVDLCAQVLSYLDSGSVHFAEELACLLAHKAVLLFKLALQRLLCAVCLPSLCLAYVRFF